MSREGVPRASWRSKWALVRRELSSLRSEKTIVLALAIQLFIAAFSSFLVVGLVSLYDPTAAEGPDLEVAITGDDRDSLERVADQQAGLDTRSYDTLGEAHSAFDDGRAAAVLDANRDDDDRLIVRVTAPDEGIGTTLVIGQLRDSLEALEYVERVENADRLESVPLTVPEEAEASPYFAFTYTILIPLLLFLPVFISGSIAVDSLIEERERATLELLRVAPLSFGDVVDSKLVATAALAPIQAIAWLVLLAANGTAIAYPAALVVLVSALALAVVGAGLAVALYSPDRRQAQLLYSGGVIGALIASLALPEHPANTVAKLAVGNPAATTWLSVAAYAVVGIVAFLGLRWVVSRLDPETL